MDNTVDGLQSLATKADDLVPGSGRVPGTKKHTAFQGLVDDLDNPLLKTEVSYKNGKIVPHGTKGSVRLDVIEYNADGTIKSWYDLKTGKAGLTQKRIDQINSHLPNVAPGIEIRP